LIKVERVPARIAIDDRECDSGIADMLRVRFNVSVIEIRLDGGDDLIGERIVIERKTAQDFALSVIDGRLFRQLQRMRQRFENACLILEGAPVPPSTTVLHPHAFKGALLSTMLAWQVPVVCSADSADTALTLWLMAEQARSFRVTSAFWRIAQEAAQKHGAQAIRGDQPHGAHCL
jgi:Fanconi anemia group M protein